MWASRLRIQDTCNKTSNQNVTLWLFHLTTLQVSQFIQRMGWTGKDLEEVMAQLGAIPEFARINYRKQRKYAVRRTDVMILEWNLLLQVQGPRLISFIIIIIIIIGATGTISKTLKNTWATYQETMKSRNYRKQPYWALHTFFRKY